MRTYMKLFGLMTVWATTLSVHAQEGDWSFKLTPYIWAAGMDGDVGVGNVSVPVDVKFTDAIKDLDLAGMLALEARNGNWGVLTDGTYLNLSDKADTQIGTFRVELEQWMINGAVIYRVSQDGNVTFDAGLGGRYMDIDTDVNVPSDRPDINSSEGWLDPLLVARLRMQFAENCFGVILGDIGGFGVESDLTWQLTAAAGYAFSDTVSMLFGYRYLDYDYDQDGLVYDVATSGLVLGLTFDL